MACSTEGMPTPWMTSATGTTTAFFLPAGQWVSSANLTGARFSGEMRGRNGNFQITPAIQLANDVRSASPSTTAIGAVASADGMIDPTTTTVSAGTARYARPGFLVALSSGSTFATGSFAGVFELIRGA
jgi:hypothetical protein